MVFKNKMILSILILLSIFQLQKFTKRLSIKKIISYIQIITMTLLKHYKPSKIKPSWHLSPFMHVNAQDWLTLCHTSVSQHTSSLCWVGEQFLAMRAEVMYNANNFRVPPISESCFPLRHTRYLIAAAAPQF